MDYDSPPKPATGPPRRRPRRPRWYASRVLEYVKNHWVAALLIVMFASSQVLTWQKADQIDHNSKQIDQQQQIFNDATCRIRDSANDQLDAIEKLRSATQAAISTAAAPGGAATPAAASADFGQLSQDVSNIKIEPVTVPPDVVCDGQ